MRLFVSGATATLRRHADRERLGTLLVPGAGNTPRLALSLGLPWAADNAAFSGFQPAAFCGLLARISGHPGCRFVACPDVVGEATATLELFRVWTPVIRALELPVALVGQDGMEKLEVLWDEIDALFLGGSTDWKLGDGAAGLAREAKRRGLWVHMGRVNTRFRFRYAFRLGCDSIDGSGFSRWPEQRVPVALRWLAELDGSPQQFSSPTVQELFRGGDPFAVRGWRVIRTNRDERGYLVDVETAADSSTCLACGDWSTLPPHRHGRRSRIIWDTPRNGVPVRLVVHRTRFRCRVCGAVSQTSAGVRRGLPLTSQFAEWLLKESHVSTCSAIDRRVGVTERTMRKWLGLLKAQVRL